MLRQLRADYMAMQATLENDGRKPYAEAVSGKSGGSKAKPIMKVAIDLQRDHDRSEKEIEDARTRSLKQHGADSDTLGRAVSALKALKYILL